MQTRDFAFWLQGLFELNPEIIKKGLTPEQTKMINDHLQLVFKHDTQFNPSVSSPTVTYPYTTPYQFEPVDTSLPWTVSWGHTIGAQSGPIAIC